LANARPYNTSNNISTTRGLNLSFELDIDH